MEVWKQIPGFDGIYEASSLGNIRRVKPSNSRRWKNCPLPFPIQQKLNKKGYLELSLHRADGTAVKCRTHRLIAKTFLPPPVMKNPEVNHIDLVKTNNCANNLEYCTRSQNWNHALTFDSIKASIPRGEAHWKARLTNAQIDEIRSMLAQSLPQKEIAAIFGVRQSMISRIKTGSLRAPLVSKS